MLRRMLGGENVSALARELGIRRKYLYQCRGGSAPEVPEALRTRGRPTKAEALAIQSHGAGSALVEAVPIVAPPADALSQAHRRIADLERKVGQQQVELDFFSEPRGRSGRRAGRAARLAPRRLRGHPSDERAALARRDRDRPDVPTGRVSRAGYYRHWQASVPRREETGLGDAIRKLVLAHRHYGHRRIAAMLHRAGWLTNHKRVPRVVREDNLLCLRRASFVPTTTDSRHGCGSCPTRRAAALSRTLAERLRGGNTFGIVTNDEDAGLANDRELLSHYRCLLSSSVTADSFGRRPLRQAATFIAKGRTSYLPILDRLICQIVSTIFPKCLFVRMYSCAASPS
jgi:hypothetical protein